MALPNIGFILFLITALACHTAIHTQPHEENITHRNLAHPDLALDLTDHLRRLPGVRVQGDGANARINLRNASSLNASTTPLFIVGYNQINDYKDVYNMLHVRDIKNIEVLKDASETSFYGVRGANGVIKITLK